MACDSFLTASLIVKTCYPQACCGLFQQVATNLQMTSCTKPDFNRIDTTYWHESSVESDHWVGSCVVWTVQVGWGREGCC